MKIELCFTVNGHRYGIEHVLDDAHLTDLAGDQAKHLLRFILGQLMASGVEKLDAETHLFKPNQSVS